MDYTICKFCNQSGAQPRYPMGRFSIYVCPHCDAHYVDQWTDFASIPDEPLTDASRRHTAELEYNTAKVDDYAAWVHQSVANGRLLDVGCGGGAFLQAAKDKGLEVEGIEPISFRYEYCRELELPVRRELITDPFWHTCAATYDVVTLWDVIEHVNDPRETLEAIYAVLKPGGALFLATPTRDSLFYRIGTTTHRLTGGRYPTLLNLIYSGSKFGHKQIFSDHQMIALLQEIGFASVDLTRKAELSYHASTPLHWWIKNERLANILGGPVDWSVRHIQVRNKMLVMARKPA